LLDRLVSARFGGSAVATALLIVFMSPLLPRVQRLVDRAMYGDRRDPAKVASRVGQQLLADPAGELGGVAGAVRNALRLPYVAVTAGGETLAAAGERSEMVLPLPLNYAGQKVGELVVGLRPGERQLSAADGNALTLVTAPLAVALHATRLSEELQSSREQIVAAREEERRRLRRDLHDGLGPTLTGMALAADAAANVAGSDLTRTRDLLDGLRRDSRQAIGDVRRLVDNLRPPALDELGLVGALRQSAEQTVRRADGEVIEVAVEAPDSLSALPAAIEVAAFRIATEAMNNVVRHSQATRAVVHLRHGKALEIEVVDDGPSVNGVWRPGVGLQAMRERAAELGGTCEAGPTPNGARVYVSLPLVAG
jgi:two-component system NarL family sensor kinase